MLNKIRIISRNSKLAMWQAEHVASLLVNYYPNMKVEIIGVTTEGDRILDKSLDKIGGKGLFIKELEYQLLANAADIAVHSLKDLPANLPEEFSIAAILERETANDALVSNKFTSLETMPVGSLIGTSSARRVAILKRYYPHLQVKLLRGNLQTRIAKLDNNEYDAIILAVAGLKRLGLESRITEVLSEEKFIPAIGQGVLAVEICKPRDDLRNLLAPLHHELTSALISAEREVGRYMNASCNIPIACYAKLQDQKLKLRAMLADNEENVFLDAESEGDLGCFQQIGQDCAQKILNAGGAKIIEKLALK